MKKISSSILATTLLLGAAIPVHAALIPTGNTASSVRTTAQQTQQPSLTFNDAVTKAFKNSKDLKNAAAEIDQAFEVRESAGDRVYYSYIPTGYGNDNEARNSVKGLAEADMNWNLSRRSFEVKKDALLYSVKAAYNEVLKAQKQKKLADAALENQIIQTGIMNLKAQNDMASEYELEQEQNKQLAAQERQKSAGKAVETAYQKLNFLIGQSQDARPVLVDEPQFKKFDQGDTQLEGHVSAVTTSSTAVWMAEQQANIKQLNLDLYSASATPYKAQEIELEKAKTNIDQQKQKLEERIRATYLQIKQLEDRYQELNSNLATAQKTLQMAKTRYEYGVGIRADVQAAELGVASTEKEIFDVVAQLDTLKLGYAMPWVLG